MARDHRALVGPIAAYWTISFATNGWFGGLGATAMGAKAAIITDLCSRIAIIRTKAGLKAPEVMLTAL